MRSLLKVFYDRNVHTHHLTYVRVGQERLEDLIFFCETHHFEVHIKRENRELKELRDSENAWKRQPQFLETEGVRRRRALKTA